MNEATEKRLSLLLRFNRLDVYKTHPLDEFKQCFFVTEDGEWEGIPESPDTWTGDPKFGNVTFQEVKDHFSEVRIVFMQALLCYQRNNGDGLDDTKVQTELALDFMEAKFFDYYGIGAGSFDGQQFCWAEEMTQDEYMMKPLSNL